MADPLGDLPALGSILERTTEAATGYLAGLADRPVRTSATDDTARRFGGALPEDGLGGAETIRRLASGLDAASASAGPRFFHFVTGGVTPAALAADWLTSTLDQNAFSWASSPLATQLEDTAVRWLLDLFDLPTGWGGVLTTGATMANFTALAAARAWWAAEHDAEVDRDGLAGLPPVPVLSSGHIHPSATKALAMLGLGRERVRRLAGPTGDLDLDALSTELRDLHGAPAIVVANAGEVNAGLFDPIDRIADLVAEHRAWLHVDGAFGLFARVAPESAGLATGIERADSVIADGHKWLNVPYDCGFAFVRDRSRLTQAFGVTASYLPAGDGGDSRPPEFGYLGPELSRRARAMAVWATVSAYGRAGYRAMVERHLALARRLAAAVAEAPELELLVPPRLNIVCFRCAPDGYPGDLDRLNARIGAGVVADGRVAFGTTTFRGVTAFRPAICNWRTTEVDVDQIVPVVTELAARELAAT